MQILVLGATGFMGKNTAEYFSSKGYDVIGTFLTNLNWPHSVSMIETNLLSEDSVNFLFDKIRPDVVIQAAAVTSGSKDIIEKPYLHVTANAVMNSWILQACYDYNVKHFVFLSCGVMYQPGDSPRKESDFNESEEIHKSYFGVGWTKVYIEKMCEFYSRLGRTKHTVIRHSNTYGPYDKYDLNHSHMLGATVRKVMDAKDNSEIEVWGNGEETARDLIYVEDVVKFIEVVLNKQVKAFDLFNIGYGHAFTVNEVVKEIIKQSGKSLKIKYDTSKPVIPTKLSFNCEKAYSIGFRTHTTFEEGVKKTLDWYKENYKVD